MQPFGHLACFNRRPGQLDWFHHLWHRGSDIIYPVRTTKFHTHQIMTQYIITFAPDGTARCLWNEAAPLHELGRLDVQRASTIEFEALTQLWGVRLTSNPDGIAFSHPSRAACLEWERNALSALP
jgi:hypothetical protein